MENHFSLTKSDDTLFVEIIVKPKFYAYLLLLVIVFALILPFIFSDFKMIGIDMIFMLIAYSVLMILFPLKYSLWNVFGKEMLIINRKSISYQYHYGFIINNLQTVTYNNLTIAYQDTLNDKENIFGKAYFYEDDENTGLPKLLHHTSVFISEDQYNLLTDEVFGLFNVDFSLN